MNFNGAFETFGFVPTDKITTLTQCVTAITDNEFNYSDVDATTGDPSWFRLDMLVNGDTATNPKLSELYRCSLDIAEYVKARCNHSGDILAFSVSMLKPHQVLADHSDGRMMHRFADRFIIPFIDEGGSYNYGYYNDSKITCSMELGKIIRINNAIIHSAVNTSSTARYTLLIDFIHPRILQKFINHADWAAPLAAGVFKFSMARKSYNKNDGSLNRTREALLRKQRLQEGPSSVL